MLTSLNIHRLFVIQLFQNKMNLKITKKQQERLTALEFTSDCWHVVELLIKVLKPFYAATKAMSGSEYRTIGLAFFIFRRLERDFLLVKSPDDGFLYRNLKQCLHEKMTYYNDIEDPAQTRTIMVSGSSSKRTDAITCLIFLVPCLFRSVWHVSDDKSGVEWR